jgi:hypothetical protein
VQALLPFYTERFDLRWIHFKSREPRLDFDAVGQTFDGQPQERIRQRSPNFFDGSVDLDFFLEASFFFGSSACCGSVIWRSLG